MIISTRNLRYFIGLIGKWATQRFMYPSLFLAESWYDNEWGYSNRCVDLTVFIGKKLEQAGSTQWQRIQIDSCSSLLKAVDDIKKGGLLMQFLLFV